MVPRRPEHPGGGGAAHHPRHRRVWDAPGGRVSSVLAYAKAKLTGDRPNIGEAKVVDL